MLPLEPLASISTVEALILGARAPEAAAEIHRLGELSHSSLEGAAATFAAGALALREGSLGPALTAFEAAARAFEAAGEREAAELCRAEALLAKMRRGPRAAVSEAEGELAALAGGASSERARVVATHYRGAALRMLGDAQATQRALLDALGRADAHPSERPKILNSLGTLYVVMGAYGAAEALLEHAAELHHRRGDAVGEAIACGQLGAAALGLGDLAKARTWLQRQEWLASRVGDAFGRARALTFLADVALDLGRPDDALELADKAREVARSTDPPLSIWLAYATRAAGRAKADLGDAAAAEELADARRRFKEISNLLGLALSEWDLVRLGGVAMDSASASDAALSWSGPAWALASLGLSARVAALLRDHALRAAKGTGAAPSASAEETFFAVAQPSPHLTVPREIELVYEAPSVLGVVSNRRTAAQRNLARLGALTLEGPGLWVATVTWSGAPSFRALPPDRASCAAIGALPGVVQWAWALGTAEAEVKRDLEGLVAALGAAGAREVATRVSREVEARVVSPPFAGEVGASVTGLGGAGELDQGVDVEGYLVT